MEGLTQPANPWADTEREEFTLETVKRVKDGWEITFDGGLGTWIGDERNSEGIQPKVGDRYTSWGRGFGSRYRGQAINGRVLWYRTQEADDAAFREEVKRSEAQRREEWEADKEDYFARIAVLPDVFRERIAIRQRNNPEFDWRYGKYELFCCEQAVLIANTLHTQKAVRQFHDALWKEQLARIPGLSDQHSGNTFGMATTLAEWYLVNPSRVKNVIGAMSPVVGSCAYGDVPPDHEFCRKGAA